MSKLDKKRKKLQERIDFLRSEMTSSLQKKTSSTSEISVSEYLSKINSLEKQLIELK